jgi:hypothetical protein
VLALSALIIRVVEKPLAIIFDPTVASMPYQHDGNDQFDQSETGAAMAARADARGRIPEHVSS